MSAVILPFENGSLPRKYPKAYDINEPVTDMLQEVIGRQEKIEWVRIRNETTDITVHHGCLGFTPNEVIELDKMVGVDIKGRKNRQKRKLDYHQPTVAPTQKNNKKKGTRASTIQN